MFQTVCQNNCFICFSIFVIVKKTPPFSNKQRESKVKYCNYQLVRRVEHESCAKEFLILMYLEPIFRI